MSKVQNSAALAAEGTRRYQANAYLEAAALFKQAADGYTKDHDGLMAAEMHNNQSVALLQAGDAAGALQCVAGTAALFAQADDKKRQALALGNQAAALAKLGRTEDAEKDYWASARLFKEIGEKDLRASVLQSVSRLQTKKGRYLEALASADASLKNRENLNFAQRILKKQLDRMKRRLDR